MKQVIQFYQTDTVREYVELADQYQLRADRKMLWLQRICFWVLKKIGARAVRTDLLIKKNTIDIKNLFDLVLRQQYELYGKYLLESRHLLVGYDEYSKFMDGTLNSHFAFEVPKHQLNNGLVVSGMRVTLVPWMSGVLVLPKEILD